MAALAFLIGVMALQPLATLPAPTLVAACTVFLASSGWVLRRVAAGAGGLLVLAALGFGWAWGAAHCRLQQGVAPDFEGRDLVVTGRVADLPQRLERRLRFVFDAESVEPEAAFVGSLPLRLRLNSYGALDQLQAGERWRLVVRLKRPRGWRNPRAFDYERWLFANGIRATGYVRRDARNRRLAPVPAWLGGAWRERLRAGLARVLEAVPNGAFLPALVLGDRSGIPAERWALLTATGTNHLLAISGLHIGLVAGLAGALVAWLWRRVPALVLGFAAQRAGAVAGVGAAGLYATLAGWALPTQRAFVMVVAVGGALLLGRGLRPGRSLSLALFAVLLLDPFAVLSPGFWLSFGAVAAIAWALAAPRGGQRRWLQAGWVSIVVGVGVLPLTLWFFQRAAPWGPVANLWAVPLVGLVTVPLALAGTALLPVWEAAARGLLWVAGGSLDLLWPVLEVVRGLPGAEWSAAPSVWSVMLALAGLAWLLAPRGWPARPMGLVLCVPLLWPRPGEEVAPGQWRATMLDVGQGLSVVVRTARHSLVFDTGARFSARFNAAEAAVIPALRAMGVRRLDALVVSHADNDHAGALEPLLAAYPPRMLWSGDARLARRLGARRCRKGTVWRWDGVAFAFLHPPPGWESRENDAACVLRISGMTGALLLTSDVERSAEAHLAAAGGLGADVLQVPHHGSATSSSEAFLDAVRPRVALVSSGYRNRWGFPRPEVLQRYARRGITVLDTAANGAITVGPGADGRSAVLRRERFDARRYWTTLP